MPVIASPDPQRAPAPAALSRRTLELWLAAARHRRRADELAGAEALKPRL